MITPAACGNLLRTDLQPGIKIGVDVKGVLACLGDVDIAGEAKGVICLALALRQIKIGEHARFDRRLALQSTFELKVGVRQPVHGKCSRIIRCQETSRYRPVADTNKRADKQC